MSALAKVFVVVNLFLSLLFFGTSATLFLRRQDLNARNVQLDQQLKKQQKETEEAIDRQKTILQLAHADIESMRKDNNLLSANLRAEQEKNKEQVARADLAESQRDQQVRMAEATHQALAARDTRIQEQDKALRDAESARDQAIDVATKAADESSRLKLDIDRANKELQALQIAHADMSARYETMELQLASAIAKGFDPVGTPATPMDALITDVEPALRAVVLNVGSDQEVKIGDEFTVHRGGEFVGKVKVVRLYKGLAGARVLYEKEGQTIAKGDQATTRVQNS